MKHSETNRWKYLVTRYLSNQISREELQEMLHKVEQEEDFTSLNHVMKEEWEKGNSSPGNSGINWDEHFNTIIKNQPAFPEKKKGGRWFRMAAAACLLAFISIGAYWYYSSQENKQKIAEEKHYDKKPGSNGGILTLADGTKIPLDSMGNGTLAMQGKTKISNRQGRIIYNAFERGDEPQMFNTITTPRSKQFQLVLADGSSVWLNAASSVRFPAAFKANERRVEITGEVYFEIAKSTAPFIVSVNGMEIKVLGTDFNVNAYPDEAVIKTTLLEGKILVSNANSQQVLQPGDQLQVDQDNKFTLLKDVDTDSEIAWKNGYFSFDNADLFSIMRQISRWYDVEIVYEGKTSNRRFGGEISRNTNVSQVLKILEESKVHFRQEEHRIVVLP